VIKMKDCLSSKKFLKRLAKNNSWHPMSGNYLDTNFVVDVDRFARWPFSFV